VHGAAVRGAQRAVLMQGASASGKSVVALSLLQCGWHLLADDAIILRNLDAPQIHTAPEWMGLPPRALALFPSLAPRVRRSGVMVDVYFDKHVFPSVEWRGDHLAQATARTIVLLDLDPAVPAPKLVRVSARDAFLALVRENLFPFHRVSLASFRRPHLDLVAALVRRADTYRLRYSMAHLDQAVSVVASAIR
jgi:hypothetical protein